MELGEVGAGEDDKMGCREAEGRDVAGRLGHGERRKGWGCGRGRIRTGKMKQGAVGGNRKGWDKEEGAEERKERGCNKGR